MNTVLSKIDAVLNTFLRWLCGVLIFAMMVLIFSQVVARYALHRSLVWSEEVGRYIFVWISFIGLVAAYKAGSHVALDLLLKLLKGKAKRTLEFINSILIIVFSSAITASGVYLFLLGMRQKSAALKIPMQYVFIVVPLSGIFLLYFALRSLGILVKNKKDAE